MPAISAIFETDGDTTVVGAPQMKYRALLLFGAPGSGKGTQGRLLGATPGFFHCACGDVFRALDVQSPLGREFMDYSTRGELVPDELTVRLADRDLAKSVGIEAWETMSEEQRRAKTVSSEKRYWEEFSKNGIERVLVMTPPDEG